MQMNLARDNVDELKKTRRLIMNQAAMKTAQNPHFMQLLERDIREQEKYFNQDPPQAPSEWQKEGQIMQVAALNKAQAQNLELSIDAIEQMTPDIVNRIW